MDERSVCPYKIESASFLSGRPLNSLGQNQEVESVPFTDEFQDVRQDRNVKFSKRSKASRTKVPLLLPFDQPVDTTLLREPERQLAKDDPFVQARTIVPTESIARRLTQVSGGMSVRSKVMGEEPSGLLEESLGENSVCKTDIGISSKSSAPVSLLSLDDLKVRLKEAISDAQYEELSRMLSVPKETMERGSLMLECRETTDYLRNHSCLLKLLEELNTYSDPFCSGYYLADRHHPILEILEEIVVKEGGGGEDTVFEMNFNIDSGDRVILSIKRRVPVIMKTPQPQSVSENPLDAQILREWELGEALASGEAKKEIKAKVIMPTIWHLKPKTFKNPDLFSALKERISNSSCDITIMVKFRDRPSMDQEKTGRGDRLATSRKNPKDFYRSEIMRLPWGDQYPKFIEIQVPFIRDIPVKDSDLIDLRKEPLRNKSHTGSYPNLQYVCDQAEVTARNMDPDKPENNAMGGDHRGAGIGVNTCDFIEFPSLVEKIGVPTLDMLEATIADVTTTATGTLNKYIENLAGLRNQNFKCCRSLGFIVGMSSNQRSKRVHANSESDNGSGNHKAEKLAEGTQDKTNKYRYALIQARFSEQEKFGTMITDPMVSALTVLNILNLELLVMYLVRDINRLLEMPGFKRVIKINIDGNPENFVIRNGWFTLIDQTPANSSINDCVFPGNKFLTKAWFKRREDFNHKLSTVFEFGLFFIPVMLFRLFHPTDADYSVFEEEGVFDTKMKDQVERQKIILDTLLGWLALDNDLVKWVESCFFSFMKKDLSIDLIEGGNCGSFIEKLSDGFNNFICGGRLPENHSVGFGSLDQASQVKFLHVCLRVVYKHLGKIKSDEKENLQEKRLVEGAYRGVTVGLSISGCYSGAEVSAILKNITCREVSVYSPLGIEDSFYRALSGSSDLPENDWGLGRDNIEVFKEELISRTKWKAVNAKNRKTIPVIMKSLDKIFVKRIDFLLVSLGCGSDKDIRAQKFSWLDSSDSAERIAVEEFRGDDSYNKCVLSLKNPTIILVNHQMNPPYLIRDVEKFQWSLVTLKDERSISVPSYRFNYKVTYAQKVSAFEQMLFDGFLSEFDKIYQQLTEGRRKNVQDFGGSFLEKMMTHLPEDCGSWQSSGNREGGAYLSMRLSLKKTSRIMLLFRVFRDVLRDANAVLPSRIYAHIPHADSGYYVCLSFRKFGGYLSRSFGKAYLPEQLEGEVAKSPTAKVISFFLSGVMGSNTGDIVAVKGENIGVRGYVGYLGRGPDNRPILSGYSNGGEPFRVFPEGFVKDRSLSDQNRRLMLNVPDQSRAYGGENLPSLDAVSLFHPVNTDG
ncbi:hypothetical protein GV64_18300 [Endozoicomonas elysicola]|uniref:Uncharacterized protein n=2 Tax=Endozoicomonas elysicola TaxID=305900 RepID=A0A081KE39_9GAMM|nr:hypothetical protein GV64_18300 [Endozoicomonas elysicola]